jgi:hypothetical protein
MHRKRGDLTAGSEVARQAEAPGTVISRGPGQPLPPRTASRQRDAILIVILLATAARSAQQAKAVGVLISRGPGQPPPRTASCQRDAILIVVVLAAAAKAAPVAMFAIVLAAIGGLVRDNLVIPRVLTWYFGPAPAWYIRRRNRRYLRQQMLDAPTG